MSTGSAGTSRASPLLHQARLPNRPSGGETCSLCDGPAANSLTFCRAPQYSSAVLHAARNVMCAGPSRHVRDHSLFEAECSKEISIMRISTKALAILAVLLLPGTLSAQGILTGTVHDPSGAVLPGVIVEAASPALIEKTRSATTDGSGQYRIIDLRPGTYALTFTLSGFTTVKRENIELSGTQTVTIPIEMRVGALAETITVAGETPLVDVQNAKREVVMNQNVIQTLPVARAVGALLNATPGLTVDTNGPALSPTMTFFNAHSSNANSAGVAGEGRMTVNGMTIAAARSGGVSSYVYDTANSEEVAITVGGGLGESDIGGPVMNLVPRSGGNSFAGTAFFNGAGSWSRGNNLTDDLRAIGLTQTPGIISSYDASGSFGGPIMKDRLWFYGSYRHLDP